MEIILEKADKSENIIDAIENQVKMDMLTRIIIRHNIEKDNSQCDDLVWLETDELIDLGLLSDQEPLAVLLAQYKRYLELKK